QRPRRVGTDRRRGGRDVPRASRDRSRRRAAPDRCGVNPAPSGSFESLPLSSAMLRTFCLFAALAALAGCSGRDVDGGALSIEPVTADGLLEEVRAVGADVVV